MISRVSLKVYVSMILLLIISISLHIGGAKNIVYGADAGLTFPPAYKEPTKEAVLPTKIRKQYDKAIAYGKTALNPPTPYHMGGNTWGVSLDCSSFVWHIYKHAGIEGLPPTRYDTNQILHSSYRITDPAPGDLVMFYGTYSNNKTNGVSHVAIYLGKGQILQESGKEANIAKIDNGYWTKFKPDFRRLKQLHSDDYESVDATSDYTSADSGGASSDSASAGNNGDSKESSSSESASTYKEFNPFVDRKVSKNPIRGLDEVGTSIPSEFMNFAYSVSSIISSVGKYIMVIGTLIMVIFLSLQIAVLAVLNNSGAGASGIFMKLEQGLFGKNTYGMDYKKKILVNFVIITVALFLVVAGFYVVSMESIYIGLNSALETLGFTKY